MYLTRFYNPQAVGYLVAEMVRCGKPTCHCQRGNRHGPYWYLYYRRFEGGAWRLHKRYVKKERLLDVRKALERTKARDRAVTDLLRHPYSALALSS